MTTTSQRERPQSVPTEIDIPALSRRIGQGVKVAPAPSGGAALATSTQLKTLGEFLEHLTAATNDTGWRTTGLVASLGDGEEAIVVGIKWINGAYYAEIR